MAYVNFNASGLFNIKLSNLLEIYRRSQCSLCNDFSITYIHVVQQGTGRRIE